MFQAQRKRRRRVILIFLCLILAAVALLWFLLFPVIGREQNRHRIYAARRSFPVSMVSEEQGSLAQKIRDSYQVTDPWALYDFSMPVPEGRAVEDDHFSTAVFLGDSLTDGLMLYSGIRAGNVFAVKGVTVFTIGQKPVLPDPAGGEDMTILEALDRSGDYDSIYVLLGVNELGDSAGNFITAYGTLIDRLQEMYPDANIYIQSMMPVNDAKAKANGTAYINNEAIVSRNAMIATLCAEKKVFFLDLFSLMADEKGALPAEKTNDGIHLYIPSYQLWYSYLKTHVAVPPAGPDAPTGRLALRTGFRWLGSSAPFSYIPPAPPVVEENHVEENI